MCTILSGCSLVGLSTRALNRSVDSCWLLKRCWRNVLYTALQRQAGHFTQVIWKDSREIGIGRAFTDNGRAVYVVCNYFPAGNVIGHVKENVFPAK